MVVVVNAIEFSNRSTRVGATDGRKETDDNMSAEKDDFQIRSDRPMIAFDRFCVLGACLEYTALETRARFVVL